MFLQKLAEKNPQVAIMVRPIADALGLDPEAYAALWLGIVIAGDVAETMKRAEAAIAEGEPEVLTPGAGYEARPEVTIAGLGDDDAGDNL